MRAKVELAMRVDLGVKQVSGNAFKRSLEDELDEGKREDELTLTE